MKMFHLPIIFSVRRRHCQLRVKPLWLAWNNEIRGKYSRQSDTTKLVERCFKNCATAARVIPNLAVLWLSWSGRDFIGAWCAEQTFPAGTLIWDRRYGCPLSAQPLNHVEAPEEESRLSFNCSHKPHRSLDARSPFFDFWKELPRLAFTVFHSPPKPGRFAPVFNDFPERSLQKNSFCQIFSGNRGAGLADSELFLIKTGSSIDQ